jgi:hypothetical protein
VLIFFLSVDRQSFISITFALTNYLDFRQVVPFIVIVAYFIYLGSFKMEPQKRAKHSKSLDPDEIEEVLMDEELEDEVMEPRVQSSSPSEDEDDAEETEVAFRAARTGDSSNFLNFTGPPNGVNRSAASDINAESSPFSIFILFFRQVFQIILTETNRYFHQYMSSRTTASISAQPPDITIQEMYKFFGLIIQMGHELRHSLKDYWSRDELYFCALYSNVIARDRFFHKE